MTCRQVGKYAGLLCVSAVLAAAARPLPDDVNLSVIARPLDDRLLLLVRAPLAAIPDMTFPLRGEQGYLDLAEFQSMQRGAARYWIAGCFDVYANGVRLGAPQVAETRVAIKSDRSFASYEEALAHLRAPDLPATTNVFSDQVWLDIQFEYPLPRGAEISLRPHVAQLAVRVATNIKYVDREFAFEGDPGLIHMAPSARVAVVQFLELGFRYLFARIDYLLFVFCLVLPLRQFSTARIPATAFAIGLGTALLAAVNGFAPDGVWFRPLIEAMIAMATLMAALANIAGRVLAPRRAAMALAFGIPFGFGASFDLSAKLQFAGAHAQLASLSYAMGAVAAVAAVTLVLVPVLSALFRFARTERVELIVVSALAADTAWHWVYERGSQLARIPLGLPVLDARFFARSLAYLAALVLIGGAIWFVKGWLESRSAEGRPA